MQIEFRKMSTVYGEANTVLRCNGPRAEASAAKKF